MGNPGPKYQNNRHNIGFRTVELYAERYGIELSRLQMKAQTGDGWISKTIEQKTRPNQIEGPLQTVDDASKNRSKAETSIAPRAVTVRQKVLLVKPLTYMNNSGEAVADLARYYRVEPEEILVVHDDLDLSPGKIRLRPGGGSGGQKGVDSISRLLGTSDYARLRIGIGRPPDKMSAHSYVLQDFLRAEADIFAPLGGPLCDAIDCWLIHGIEPAMNQFNRKNK
ncbi:aminoacyl-tRNA hydrolase [Chloroflexi bacterium TSY]|nr:aminoacyl-tRNA hydrolase [Chloroflexi bacterium TSY]